MNREAFDRIMTDLGAPLVVVTTAAEHERAGCLVGFHAQCGMEPPALAIWLSRANHTFRVAMFAETFAVHFLGTGDRDLAELFGTITGDDEDKFARCDWHPGPGGVPLLDGCGDVVVGTKAAMLDTGTDHVCIVLDPIDARSTGRLDPLRVPAMTDVSPGHEAEERPEPRTTQAPA